MFIFIRVNGRNYNVYGLMFKMYGMFTAIMLTKKTIGKIPMQYQLILHIFLFIVYVHVAALCLH